MGRFIITCFIENTNIAGAFGIRSQQAKSLSTSYSVPVVELDMRELSGIKVCGEPIWIGPHLMQIL